MTEILAAGGERRRAGVRRMKRSIVRIDMTPMVDLGFLLITFFVMTAELSRPSVVSLASPKDGPSMPVPNSAALTVLLAGKGHIYYYEGDWKDALSKNQVYSTSLSVSGGLGKIIREKQQALQGSKIKEGRDALMLMIKAGKESSYQMLVDALDEALINMVKRYTLLPASGEEEVWMKNKNSNRY